MTDQTPEALHQAFLRDRWLSYQLYVLWLRLWYPHIKLVEADRHQAQHLFDACRRSIAAKRET